jgi:hypothetical protein
LAHIAKIGFPVDRASSENPKLDMERVKHDTTIASATRALPSSIRLKKIANAGADATYA